MGPIALGSSPGPRPLSEGVWLLSCVRGSIKWCDKEPVAYEGLSAGDLVDLAEAPSSAQHVTCSAYCPRGK